MMDPCFTADLAVQRCAHTRTPLGEEGRYCGEYLALRLEANLSSPDIFVHGHLINCATP